MSDGRRIMCFREKEIMKMLKKVFCLLLCICLSACVSGETTTTESGNYDYLLDSSSLPKPDLELGYASGALYEIINRGVLKVSTSPDYPPAEYVDENGKVYGSEMMLAKYIADCLGVELQIETMDFNATLTAVSTGKTDIAISGFSWSSNRAENFELSIGYQGDSEAACHTLLTYSDTVDNYKSLSDFDGKKIVVQANSIQEVYVNDQIEDANVEVVTSIDQAILNLAAYKTDAVALDCDTAKMYASQSNGLASVSDVQFNLDKYGDYEGNVIACRKGELDLINTINKIIECVKENGLYNQWYVASKEMVGME